MPENEWQHFDDHRTELHASVHPGQEAVSVCYPGSDDILVLDAAHIDALIALLVRVKGAIR